MNTIINPPTPQQARAVATREKIIRATVAVLSESGVASASTGSVAKFAGVSQGALFRHFPSKALLLATATERILDDLFTDTGVQFVEAFDGEDPVRAGVDALWAVFTDTRLYGAFEVFLAARTDEDLRGYIEPILIGHAERELEFAKLIFPLAAERSDFGSVVYGILSTLQGAALVAGTITDSPGAFERQFIEDIVRRHLGEPAQSGAAQ
ncbi:MAG: AcrR family transcriptional regulator [Bradymonadia bacterium]|jgi:AcrR family transcriptional regulator